jgi:RNA polymerase sigma factor (sigma-70 family)
VLAVDEALERLRAFDPRKADVVELHYFGGMNQDEIAEALCVSSRTVFQDLKLAKAWMARELSS